MENTDTQGVQTNGNMRETYIIDGNLVSPKFVDKNGNPPAYIKRAENTRKLDLPQDDESENDKGMILIAIPIILLAISLAAFIFLL